jgi:hypothetical protein
VWTLFATFPLLDSASPLLRGCYPLHRSYGRLRLPAGVEETSRFSPLHPLYCPILTQTKQALPSSLQVSVPGSPASLTPVDSVARTIAQSPAPLVACECLQCSRHPQSLLFRGSICSAFRLPALQNFLSTLNSYRYLHESKTRISHG